MPAGNDTEQHAAFRLAVESQFGSFQNAEDLIRAHQAAIDPAVRRAGVSRIDEDATAKLKEDGKDGYDKVAKKFDGLPEGAELEDFAVRGNTLVGVFALPDGTHVKRLTGANSRYDEAKAIRPEERAAYAQWQAEEKVRQETARLQAEADAEIEKVRGEQNERIAKELAKMREQADAEIQKAQESAGEGDGAGSGGKKQSGSGGKSS